MWFKNIQWFRFASPFDWEIEALEKQLQESAFVPCGKHDMMRLGFCSPLGKNYDQLVHSQQGCHLLCLRKQEKILPNAAIKEMVEERAELIENTESRRLSRKERTDLKETIIQESLPNAFIRTQQTYAYIDTNHQWLVVDAASAQRAEEWITTLRKALGSLPVERIQTQSSPANIMSNWLVQQDLPKDIELGQDIELKAEASEGGIISGKQHDLLSPEIAQHIESGKRVSKLAFNWQNTLSCQLIEDLSIKRVRFSDELIDQAEREANGDPIAQLDADFALMHSQLAGFFPQLIEWFDGELNDRI